jgi:hypothetical protein
VAGKKHDYLLADNDLFKQRFPEKSSPCKLFDPKDSIGQGVLPYALTLTAYT